ncbi:MAG: diguanylate cyclase [Chloroflexota bacterium]|nr:diguanylate cyclase [Chloroflexota bacterium]
MRRFHDRFYHLLVPLYWFLPIAAIIGVLNILISSLLTSLLPPNFAKIDIAISIVGVIFGIISCFVALLIPRTHLAASQAHSHLQNPSIQWRGPLLLGLVYCGQAIGQSIQFANSAPRSLLVPTWADPFFLIQYPLLILVLLNLPRRPLSTATSSRVVLDSLMLILTICTLAWYFVLGPFMLQGHQAFFLKLLGAAYPFGDLVMLCCFLILTASSGRLQLRPATWLLLLGIASLIISDTINEYTTLQNSAAPLILSGIPMITSISAYALFTFSTYYMRFAGLRPRVPDEAGQTTGGLGKAQVQSPSLWLSLLPYILVPIILLLILSSWRSGIQGPLQQGVYIGGAALLALIMLRQVFTVREAMHYSKQLSQANGLLKTLADTDPLTGLSNHRALLSMLEQEVQPNQSSQRPCAMLFFDLDYFKALNDGYGHAAGDTVLRECAGVVRASVRGTDLVGRWGGEEFIVILPETLVDEALLVAERLRSDVSEHIFTVGGGIHLTCSVGVACYPLHAQDLDALISTADHAMYRAKRLGRNQVRAAGDPAILTLPVGTQFVASGGEGREEIATRGTIEALVALLESHDSSMSQRLYQATDLVVDTASALGMPPSEAQMLVSAWLLHDIGKTAISTTILHKPGPLMAAEWKVVQTHAAVGAEIVSHIPALRPIAPAIRAHHEHWDGQGYPDQLAGTDIPLGARILAVIDAYTAMISERPYQEARTPLAAISELLHCSGTQFDPQVVEALAASIQVQRDPSLPSLAGIA